ncbi:MAG: type II secretion system protein GspM [Pseudomonas sp.]|uniref:type II secretion system protein GspM n=1 Tax=Pseudomonas sp. TaxID=306 RepID=UPI001DE0D416|nr:type II secretion system protein GspM [Pseudomonas sp.]MPT00421.1 type II secretion system protein GspM [Pseudomonas sp.]
MNLYGLQRKRGVLAGCLIGLLVAVLVTREGLSLWRELGQWRELAQTAGRLPGGPALSLERLHQSALVARVDISQVEPQGERWQVRGQVADAQHLQGWLQTLQAEGVQPLQWGLEQDAGRLRFDLLVQP